LTPDVSAELERDGLTLLPSLLSEDALIALERILPASMDNAGIRIFGSRAIEEWQSAGPVGSMARSILGPPSRPVRAILFDKNAKANWSLDWHQDRTIALRERVDVPGVDHWTSKSGVAHAEPPFSIIENMLTARIHLDPVTEKNAPLLVAPGSHRLGRIRKSEISNTVERCGTVACLANRGDVWLYRTAILHASKCSRSEVRRRVLQIDFSSAELPVPLEWLGLD
jgi:hypothetical protein